MLHFGIDIALADFPRNLCRFNVAKVFPDRRQRRRELHLGFTSRFGKIKGADPHRQLVVSCIRLGSEGDRLGVYFSGVAVTPIVPRHAAWLALLAQTFRDVAETV